MGVQARLLLLETGEMTLYFIFSGGVFEQRSY